MSEPKRGKRKRYDGREVVVWEPDFDYPFINEDIERWKYDMDIDRIDDELYVIEVQVNGQLYDVFCYYTFEEDSYSIVEVTQRNKELM